MPTKEAVHGQQAPAYLFLGVKMTIHLSGAQTGGGFSLIEAEMPASGDGGLHAHTREDESVYLLEGELTVTIADQTFSLKAGECYFVPRNTPHRFRNTSDTVARAILINTPGTFDELVRRGGVPFEEPRATCELPDSPDIQKLLSLATEFGVQILAPPTRDEHHGADGNV